MSLLNNLYATKIKYVYIKLNIVNKPINNTL